MTTPVPPSMNAMVDAVTDAVEAAIARGNAHPGGVRRFIIQGAVRRVLREIGLRRIPPRRFHGNGGNAGGRPGTPRLVPRSSRLEYAAGVCPRHGPAMFVRSAGTPMEPPPTTPTPPWNGGSDSMAGRHGAPPSAPRRTEFGAWPPGFAFDLNVALPPPPPSPIAPPANRLQTRSRTYAEAAATPPASRLPPANALGAGFASPSKGEAAPHR